MNQDLLTERFEGDHGVVLKFTLNAEKRLNALSKPMIDVFRREIAEATENPEVRCAVITGAGEKSFCAGGDIKSCYFKIENGNFTEVENFFRAEYSMNYELASFSKPLISLGKGLVIGEGAGILQASRYRVISKNTRFSMPETQIGLYPDAGAGFFFRQIPKTYQLFLALTGVMIGSGDILNLGLADFLIPPENFETVFRSLTEIRWTNSNEENHARVFNCLKNESTPAEVFPSELPAIGQEISKIIDPSNLEKICSGLLALPGQDRLSKSARENIRYASPLSLAIIFRHLEASRRMSLREVIDSEYLLSVFCLRFGDFKEGVRALLIDRDHDPKWRYPSLKEIPQKFLDDCFNPKLSTN